MGPIPPVQHIVESSQPVSQGLLKEHLNTVYGIDAAVLLRRAGDLQGALDVLNDYLSFELAPYERGWALLEKAHVLGRMDGHSAEEIDAIFRAIISNYAASDPSGQLLPAALYEQSKLTSSIELLTQAIALAEVAEYTGFKREVRLLQMTIRMGRYLRVAERLEEARLSLEQTIQQLITLEQNESEANWRLYIAGELCVAHKEMALTYDALHNADLAEFHRQAMRDSEGRVQAMRALEPV